MTLEETITRVVNAAGDKLPQVAEVAGKYYQMDAVSDLRAGAVLLAFAGIAGLGWRWARSKYREFMAAGRTGKADDWAFVMGVIFCLGCLLFAGGIFMITNPKAWAAAFSPDLALFKGALEAVRK